MDEEMKIIMLQKLVEDIVSKHEGAAAVMVKIGPYTGSSFKCKNVEEFTSSIMLPLDSVLAEIAKDLGVEKAALLTQSLLVSLLGAVIAFCRHHNATAETLKQFQDSMNAVLRDHMLLTMAAQAASEAMYSQHKKFEC